MSRRRMLMNTEQPTPSEWDYEASGGDIETSSSVPACPLGIQTIAGHLYRVRGEIEYVVTNNTDIITRYPSVRFPYSWSITETNMPVFQFAVSGEFPKTAERSFDIIMMANRSLAADSMWNSNFRYCSGTVKIKNYQIEEVQNVVTQIISPAEYNSINTRGTVYCVYANITLGKKYRVIYSMSVECTEKGTSGISDFNYGSYQAWNKLALSRKYDIGIGTFSFTFDEVLEAKRTLVNGVVLGADSTNVAISVITNKVWIVEVE